MPVGTQATVKAMTPTELADIGFRIILGNTYHLHLRPGEEIVARAGGLHRYQAWSGALLTDSGGFQVFSLAGLRRLGADGVEFQSYIDGSKHLFTPESVMQVQRDLGADIVMAFDECAPYPCTRDYAAEAMFRTHAWAERCVSAYNGAERMATGGWPQALFGNVQGGVFPDLRRESAEFLTSLDLPGYAIGGLAVGEEASARNETIAETTARLPASKPRYLMGVGTPIDIIEAVGRGVDMFDCVLPTRNARNAQVFTSRGVLNMRNAQFNEDFEPLDANCRCAVCALHTRAYVRHLFRANEMLGPRLTTYHNLSFYHRLMRDIRAAIVTGTFGEFRKTFISEYSGSGASSVSVDEATQIVEDGAGPKREAARVRHGRE